MNLKFEIPLPWSVLHAATIEHLPGYAPGAVSFIHGIPSPESFSIFDLSNTDLGTIGSITLRKVSDKVTSLSITEPSGTKQKEHQEMVLTAYFNRLVHDVSIWTSNESYPPRYLLGYADIDVDTVDHFGTNFGDFIRRAIAVDIAKDNSEQYQPQKSKSGKRLLYSEKEKIDAVREWDALDKRTSPVVLVEWLGYKFGTNLDGAPLVAKSTFYDWRKKFKGN